ncbi:hypothetical protein GGS21DRAFT_544959 [Xylaria nigripes]|nr:hypothetical protein GGS21DRAFT_544959 [Xylaria nigripes]
MPLRLLSTIGKKRWFITNRYSQHGLRTQWKALLRAAATRPPSVQTRLRLSLMSSPMRHVLPMSPRPRPKKRLSTSLAPPRFLEGKLYNYHTIKPVGGSKDSKGKQLSTVWKAKPSQSEDITDIPKRAIIKMVPPGDEGARASLECERALYQLPEVRNSSCFRKMYDDVNEDIIALEWLDTTLADVKWNPFHMNSYRIIKEVLKAALESCVILTHLGLVNTGINSLSLEVKVIPHRLTSPDFKDANMLLSGINTNQITAKVGDLGQIIKSGTVHECQPLAMRAPEIWLLEPCTEAAQIWAIAAMILCWIKPGILGSRGSPFFTLDQGWSMARLNKLFPEWKFSIPNMEQLIKEIEDIDLGDDNSEDFNSEDLEDLEDLRYIEGNNVAEITFADDTVDGRLERRVVQWSQLKNAPEVYSALPFDQQIRSIFVKEEVRNILRLMLVVDPSKRPSASALLTSPEFRALEKLVADS